jgi:hypothetical protein
MLDLRTLLREITENGRPDSHPALIEELRKTFPHGIQVLPSHTPIHRYTCAMYALDLVENPEYIAIVMASPDHVFASTAFVQRLLDRGVLERAKQRKKGCLVVYRDNRIVKHIGKLVSRDRVISKWGIGHLYEHGLNEAPSQYGNGIEFFSAIDADTALDELVTFAKENGVRFEDDS